MSLPLSTAMHPIGDCRRFFGSLETLLNAGMLPERQESLNLVAFGRNKARAAKLPVASRARSRIRAA